MLVAACYGIMAASSFAQNAGSNKASTTKTSAKYCCPKCKDASNQPGACAHCHAKLVKEGSYYCPTCNETSGSAGKCNACKKDMVKMTAKKA